MQDILIIGQGLAGSILGYELIAKGFNITVVDQCTHTSSSQIAAGILNPITGKRLKKDKHFELFLGAAQSFYSQIEQQFNISCFHKRDMLRVVRNKNELKKLEARKEDSSYKPYIKTTYTPNTFKDIHNDLFGSFELNSVYTLDTKIFLKTLQTFLKNKGSLLKATFQYTDLEFKNNKTTFQKKTYDYVIFCEGYKAMNNPWFSWLPFNPAKGEILTLKSDKKFPQQIINSKRWIVPIDTHEAKLGATYSWEPLDEEPTQEGKSELLESIPTLLKDPGNIDIQSHEAAVRPCTQDNNPFIGFHPQQPCLGIFNGFGTKGTLLIPLFAKQFIDNLEGNPTLLPEANINRIPYE